MPNPLIRRYRALCAVTFAIGLAFPILFTGTASAFEPSWPDLRASLYGDLFLGTAADVIELEAPYRTSDDARTVIAARIAAPDGQLLDDVTLILDENPMPVSTVFKFADPVRAFDFSATLRVNGPTPIHIVARLDNGQLFMAEGFVKTSGQGACAAPPGSDPEEALATLGNMNLAILRKSGVADIAARATNDEQQDLNLEVDISHPSHSGMQMDQISLLYLPARYVETLEIELNGGPFATMTGSISLSENPQVTLSVPAGTRHVRATLTDTDGTVSKAERSLADY